MCRLYSIFFPFLIVSTTVFLSVIVGFSAEQPHAKIETVSGDIIGFRLNNASGWFRWSRLDVNFSVGEVLIIIRLAQKSKS